MYPAPLTAPGFTPGQKIKIINKVNQPEPEGEVLIHDKDRMLVLVTVFHTERGTATWWIPEYMVKKLDAQPERHPEPSRA